MVAPFKYCDSCVCIKTCKYIFSIPTITPYSRERNRNGILDKFIEEDVNFCSDIVIFDDAMIGTIKPVISLVGLRWHLYKFQFLIAHTLRNRKDFEIMKHPINLSCDEGYIFGNSHYDFFSDSPSTTVISVECSCAAIN